MQHHLLIVPALAYLQTHTNLQQYKFAFLSNNSYP